MFFRFPEMLKCCLATVTLLFLAAKAARPSEIVPDRALGSTVNTEGSLHEISGGTRRGGNLFHGFERFDIPAGSTASFTLIEGIDRAFVRITGGEASQIFGNIAADRPADFYFLNPQGFLFGPEASVNISGSFAFLGSNRLDFADGGEFSPSSTGESVLSISGPVGFHATRGSRIEVRGTGHNFLLDDSSDPESPIPPVVNAGQSENGLRAKPGQQVSLAAEDIVFDGGILTVPAGTISVAAASGELQFEGESIALAPEAIPGNLILTERALFDVSGDSNGNVFVTAGTLDILDGSHIWGQSERGGSGIFRIETTERLNIRGRSKVTDVEFDEALSAISTISVVSFAGRTSTLEVETPLIEITAGGAIANYHFFEGSGGQTNIQTDNLFILGTSVDFPETFNSQVGSVTQSTNPNTAGSIINIDAESILAVGGGAISSFTFRRAAGGDIFVSANEVELNGVRDLAPDDVTSSAIVAGTFGPAMGGGIIVNAKSLLVSGGGNVGTLASGAGSAGDITITGDLVEVTGFFEDPARGIFFPSFIGSNANPIIEIINVPQEIRDLLEQDSPTGDSNNITIDANEVRVENFAFVSVGNEGFGNSGRLNIISDKVFLGNNGQLEGRTISGLGGEIAIVSDILELDSGHITTNSFFDANGGGIDLQSTIIIARNGSELSATADNGDGGRISFDVEGLFLSPDTTVTAASENGRDGVVLFGEFTDLSSEVDFPVEPLFFNPEVLISSKCSPGSSGKFTTAGNRQELLRRHGIIDSLEEAAGIAKNNNGETVLVSQCPFSGDRPS